MKNLIKTFVCVIALLAVILVIISAEVIEETDPEDRTTETEYVTEEETTEEIAASAVFSINSYTIVVNEFSVRAVMTAENLRGGKFELKYDPDKLQVADIRTFDGDGAAFFSKADEGSLAVLFFTDDVFSGEMTVLTVDFKAANVISGEKVKISIENAEISNGKSDLSVEGAERFIFVLKDKEPDSETVTEKITETETVTEPETETEIPETTEPQTEAITEAETEILTEQTDTVPAAETETAETTAETEEITSETEQATDERTEPAATEAHTPKETEAKTVSGENGGAVPIIIAAAVILTAVTFLIASISRKKENKQK